MPKVVGLSEAILPFHLGFSRSQKELNSVGCNGCCYEYDRIVDEFKKKHPKIKVTTVLGAGGQLGARVLAERRGDKYLADVFSGGANTIHDVLYKAQALEPIKAKLILPEVIDASKWYEGEHRYIDPEQRYIFAFVANSQTGQVQYNRAQVHPTEFSSFWDLLNPKWKGKMASLDPTTFGMGAALQFFYYHPDLGPAFLRKLYGEMRVTVSRDARQMTDWLVSGKFPLCIRCNAGSEVGKAKDQGLPIGIPRHRKLERGRQLQRGWRNPGHPESRSASQCGKSVHQLVSFPRGTNRAAETRSSRRSQLAPDRHSER